MDVGTLASTEVESLHDSDEHLAKQAIAGDVHAFAELVTKYQTMARAIAYNASGDWDAAEDLTQEALLLAWTKITELQDPARFRPWLATIVRNAAHNLRRYQTRHAPRAELGLSDLETLPSSAPGPLQQALSRQRFSTASHAFGSLSGRYREILLLYFSLGESHQEVANALGLSEANARQRLARARKKLKGEMQELSSQGRALARHSIRAAALVLLIRSRAALAKPAASATAPHSAGSSMSIAVSVAGTALLGCIIAIVVLLTHAKHSAPSPASSPATAKASAAPIEAASSLAGSPRALVRMGDVQAKATTSSDTASRAKPESMPSSSQPSRAKNANGQLTLHGPAVLHKKPLHKRNRAAALPEVSVQPVKTLLKPSADLQDVRRSLLMEF